MEVSKEEPVGLVVSCKVDRSLQMGLNQTVTMTMMMTVLTKTQSSNIDQFHILVVSIAFALNPYPPRPRFLQSLSHTMLHHGRRQGKFTFLTYARS